MTKEFPHAKSREEILADFLTTERGLSARQVLEQRSVFGENVLVEAPPDPLWKIFFRQFQSPLIYILAASSAAILLVGEANDAAIIVFVLIFNAVVGTIQEGKAQNTLASLKQFVETKAAVMRGGIEEIVRDTEIVPGDILILREGDRVSADARLLEVRNLAVNESALTGESEPVYKTAETLGAQMLPTAEMKNMVFQGTGVLAGSASAIAVATGTLTVIGKISQEVAGIKTEDPLQRDMKELSRLIIKAVGALCAVLFVVGVVSGKGWGEMFATVISLSVSVIPEGLPIVLTLVLATGVWRMGKRNALVKKLQAVESLGQARIIAVDKTGTITKNELVVQQADAEGKLFDIEGLGYEPAGKITSGGRPVRPKDQPGLMALARSAALCASAQVLFSEEKKVWQIAGDPTEAALLVFAEKAGFNKIELDRDMPPLAEIPFSSEKKYHAVLSTHAEGSLLSVTGAPEAVFGACSFIQENDSARPMTARDFAALEETIRKMSERGLRVLAVASAPSQSRTLEESDIAKLVLLGLVGMKDVLRPEVKEALTRARSAGIRVVMITGDHALTARSIGREAGVYTPGSLVLSGQDIEAMTDEQLAEAAGRTSIFARVTPEHKLRIIRAYKSRGEIIAMTGDGVNDAPSLVAADLGVAMGKIGTEVAKEAADIILLDDNFGSIVSAVEEGRNIYKTIKKVILYLFSTSLGEVLVIGGSIFLGLPLPVLPSQIIWLNFVTDGFLDISLAMEPKERGLLTEKVAVKASFVDPAMIRRMISMALPMGICSLLLFSWYWETGPDKARTMTLTLLAMFQWLNAWNCRSDKESVFRMNPWSNKFLVGATVLVALLHVLAVYNPFMQRFLDTVPLTAREWLIVACMALSIIVVEEIRKLLVRRKAV